MSSIRALVGICLGIAVAVMPVVGSGEEKSQPFDFNAVIEKARERASQAYQAPPEVPQFLQDLTYNQYQEIRFKPEASLWQSDDSEFEIMTVTPGMYYGHPVQLNQVDGEGVREIPFRKSDFTYPTEELAKRIPADLGYAGFKVTYPLNTADTQNQFLVFAGASYFRGVGSANTFGVSGRGIAVDTGLRSGEEFPNFVEYWLVRPAADADSMVVYGLLDGPSVTGAYRFEVYPGDQTRVEVRSRLFFRENIGLLGVAPLTSMFYYGSNTVKPAGEWRPQVHDSDGLLIHDGVSGEWLWRPLINPRSLRMSYLQTNNVQGFGLMQRDTGFSGYEDMSARYDKRPSAWVETEGDWGKGEVVLVEIPTSSEANDNIVAFWRPQTPVESGDELDFGYSVSFGGPDITGQPLAPAVQTFLGDGNRLGGGAEAGAYRVIVDFAGGPLDELDPTAAVVSKVSGGKSAEVLEHFVEHIGPTNRWRISMLVRPAPEQTLALRAYLSLDSKPLTETWTYELPAGEDVRAGR